MKISIFIIILLVYLFANIYIFHRIWTSMPPSNIMRVILVAAGILLTGAFFISAIFGETLPIPVTSFFYKTGSSWMFITIYFILIFLLQDLVILINKFTHFIPSHILTQFSKGNWSAMLFTMAFIFLLMLGGYLNYTSKDRVYHSFKLSAPLKDTILNKPLKIVATSDWHLGYTIGKDELKEWVQLINSEQPDIVLIAGDLIDNSIRPVTEGNFAEELKKINAPLGVYACLGNHEYIGHIAQSRENLNFFKEAGIHLLRDNYAEINNSFYIVGRDDKSNKNRKDLDILLKDLDRSKPVILLDHQPYNLEDVEKNKVDLQISGHTHQGQIWPVSALTNLLYEEDHGLVRKGSSNIYVSSGIGLWGGKFRIGTSSEYVVIEID